MERRDFLKTSLSGLLLPALPTTPAIPAKAKTTGPVTISTTKPLWIEKIAPQSDHTIFGKGHYRIWKDSFFAECGHIEPSDIRDSHGMCATYELVHEMKAEIIYGREGLAKLLSLDWDSPPEAFRFWRNRLARTRLTQRDDFRLIKFFHEMQGDHPCVLSEKNKKTLDWICRSVTI